MRLILIKRQLSRPFVGFLRPVKPIIQRNRKERVALLAHTLLFFLCPAN